MRSLLLSLSLYLCSLIPSLLAPPKEAKIESQNSKQPSNTQVCDTWVSHRNWQISDFLPLRGKSKPCVPRKKRHHSGPSTQQKKPLHQPPFERNYPIISCYTATFPLGLPLQRQVCPLIQVWCRETKGKGGGGGQYMAFSMVSLGSPGLGVRVWGEEGLKSLGWEQ